MRVVRDTDLPVITDEQLSAYAANTDPLHGELAMVAAELLRTRDTYRNLVATLFGIDTPKDMPPCGPSLN